MVVLVSVKHCTPDTSFSFSYDDHPLQPHATQPTNQRPLAIYEDEEKVDSGRAGKGGLAGWGLMGV